MKDLAAVQTLGLLVVSFIICWFWQSNRQRSPRNLLISIVVIALACMHARFMVDLSGIVDLIAHKGIVSKEEAADAQAAAAIWAGVASLAVGGVGVNLLSSWFDS